MSQTESSQTCPDCGAPLPPESPQALCPACLLRQALASRTLAGKDKTPSPTPPTPEEIADQFPQFEITECLGRGGMGVVYKARQKSLDRWVAIKVLAPERSGEEKFAERFAREAATLAKLNHPNIVTVHDFGETGAIFYIVMEYVDGVNLRDLLRDGKMDPKQALAIVPPICDALQYAHDKGIVHRDIKPENLLLDREGRVKIADFGIAALVGAGGEPAGTPPYMAPEQVEPRSEVDHRADIYALGVVLYEMLTGERPGKQIEAPSKKVQIDVRLDEIVLRALERKPELRYQQASDVKTMVETIVTTPLPQNASAEVAPEGVSTAGSPSKVSLCYITTPEHLRSFRGRFINIYKGKGELRLDSEALSFHSGWPTVTIPLSSIRKLAQGDYPYSAKPVPLHYIAVTFAERGEERTLLFTPVIHEVMLPDAANKLGTEWLAAIQDAFLANTGRALSLERSDIGQDRFWVIKTFLATAVSCTIGLWTIPLVLHQRLPNQLSEWLPMTALITALAITALFLFVRWWQRRFASIGLVAMLIIALPIAVISFSVAAILAIRSVKALHRALTGEPAKTPQAKDQLPRQLTQEGWQLWQARKLAEAEAKFQEAVRLAPGDANAWNGLGWAQFNAGNSKSAEQAFLKSIGIEPTQPGALNGLGQIYLSQRKYDDAEKFLLKAAPQAPAAWFGLARLYLLEGKYSQAESWAQKIEDSGQADEVAKKMLEAAKARKLSDGLRLMIEPAPANKSSQAQPANSAVRGDTWSPTLAPDEKPNFQNIRTEADTLMNQGRFDEALQRHIWYFNHALEYGESNPVRLSFGLMGWGELARRYPPARQALIDIRNRDAQLFSNGGGCFNLFLEVTNVNRTLREDDATVALFNSVRKKNAAVAKQCYFAAETLLVSKGEYALCLSYLGDPMAKFKHLLEQWNMGKDGNSRDVYANIFVGETCRLIEILVGTGHKAEAEAIRNQAVAALDDARLKLAIGDAEERVRQRSRQGEKEKNSAGTPLPPRRD